MAPRHGHGAAEESEARELSWALRAREAGEVASAQESSPPAPGKTFPAQGEGCPPETLWAVGALCSQTSAAPALWPLGHRRSRAEAGAASLKTEEEQPPRAPLLGR